MAGDLKVFQDTNSSTVPPMKAASPRRAEGQLGSAAARGRQNTTEADPAQNPGRSLLQERPHFQKPGWGHFHLPSLLDQPTASHLGKWGVGGADRLEAG
jgi:hypothetical protein